MSAEASAAGPAVERVDLPGDQPMTLVDWLNASLGWIAAGELDLARDKIEEVAAELAAREDTALAGRTAEGGAGDGWRPSRKAPKDGTWSLWRGFNREGERTHCVIRWPEFDLCFEEGEFMPIPGDAASPSRPAEVADVQAKADARRAAPAAGVDLDGIDRVALASAQRAIDGMRRGLSAGCNYRDRLLSSGELNAVSSLISVALAARDRGPADPRAGADVVRTENGLPFEPAEVHDLALGWRVFIGPDRECFDVPSEVMARRLAAAADAHARDAVRHADPRVEAVTEGQSDEKILKLLALATAARQWAGDRDPEDWTERALFVALFDAFPDDFPGRENCGCDQSEMACDECPSIHEIRANMAEWRAEGADRARIAAEDRARGAEGGEA